MAKPFVGIERKFVEHLPGFKDAISFESWPSRFRPDYRLKCRGAPLPREIPPGLAFSGTATEAEEAEARRNRLLYTICLGEIQRLYSQISSA